MKDKLTKQVAQGYNTAKQIVHGAEHLVLAVSIIIVSFYNVYDLQVRAVGNFELYTRSFASVVVALTGAWHVAKVLKAIGEKN